MFNDTMKMFKTALILFLTLTLVTGIVYPLLVAGLAQLFYPWQANGSLLTKNGVAVGSRLIGQSFNHPEYFWGRPSATTPNPYNGASSQGSNSGPSNLQFLAKVQSRINQLRLENPNTTIPIPIDLITASGSGLDPHISPRSAFYQAARVAQARQLPISSINTFIQNHIEARTLGLLGEPRVNVLALNIALDNQAPLMRSIR